MGGAIAKVLLIIVVIAYCGLFISWNQQPVTVVGLVDFQGTPWWQEMPLGYLPLGGAVIGALFMAIVAWSEWARQKVAADRAQSQVRKAKVKLEELLAKIKQQRQQIDELRQQTAAQKPCGGPDSAAQIAPDEPKPQKETL